MARKFLGLLKSTDDTASTEFEQWKRLFNVQNKDFFWSVTTCSLHL